MAEYIERETLRVILERHYALWKRAVNNGSASEDGTTAMGEAIFDLMTHPAADVAPAVHGRWYDINSKVFKPHCSICLEDSPKRGYTPNYCPNCGARMDGGDDHAAD